MNEKISEFKNDDSPTFIFGSYQHKVIGFINIRITTIESFFLNFDTDVVELDVPLLMGLYFMTDFRLIL